MQIICRPRDSGKTTILLHYMVAYPDSLYVNRLVDGAERAFELSQALRLNLARAQFVGATDKKIGIQRNRNLPVLVDDIDCIIKRHPEIGYELLNAATIITISSTF